MIPFRSDNETQTLRMSEMKASHWLHRSAGLAARPSRAENSLGSARLIGHDATGFLSVAVILGERPRQSSSSAIVLCSYWATAGFKSPINFFRPAINL